MKPPTMTASKFQSLTPADISEMGRQMEQVLRSSLPAQGNQLVEFLGMRREQMSGFPALVTEYRRTGRAGVVRVQLNDLYTGSQEVEINLSYRESEARRWKPVIANIRHSISVTEAQ